MLDMLKKSNWLQISICKGPLEGHFSKPSIRTETIMWQKWKRDMGQKTFGRGVAGGNAVKSEVEAIDRRK